MFSVFLVEQHDCSLLSPEGDDWRPRAAIQLLRLMIPVNSLTFDLESQQWRIASDARGQLADWLEYVAGDLEGQVIRESEVAA